MILDSGVLTIYAVSSTEGTAPPPVKWTLSEKRTAVFGDRVVGATRYYAAAKVGQRIDRAVRIWRDHTIPMSVRDVCLTDGIYYLIRKITHHGRGRPSGNGSGPRGERRSDKGVSR